MEVMSSILSYSVLFFTKVAPSSILFGVDKYKKNVQKKSYEALAELVNDLIHSWEDVASILGYNKSFFGRA